MNQELVKAIADCDENIIIFQTVLDDLEKSKNDALLRLASIGADKEMLIVTESNKQSMEYFRTRIKIEKVKKILFNSISKSKTPAIFDLLLAKYDNLVNDAYESESLQ